MRQRRTRASAGHRLVITATALAMLVTLAGCSTAAGGGTSDSDGGAAPVAASAVGADRAVVVTGSMSITTDDVAAAAAEAVTITTTAGGRVNGRDERSNDDDAQTTLTLRVPAASLDDVIDQLRTLGTTQAVTTASSDVTTTVQDTGARVAALQQTLERLRGFQASATTVDDLLAVETEITARQSELESLGAEQAALAEQVDLSTLTVTFRSTPPLLRAAPDGFAGGLAVGWAGLVIFFGAVVTGLGILLPWLLAGVIVAAMVIVVVRIVRRRRPHRRSEPSPSMPAPYGPSPYGNGAHPASAAPPGDVSRPPAHS